MTTPDQPVDVLLSDGSTVQLRPIDPADAPGIVAMHSRFSERTRYLRYFSPYPRIPERDLIRFVTVDHHDREAFVVLAAGHSVGQAELIGHVKDHLAKFKAPKSVDFVLELPRTSTGKIRKDVLRNTEWAGHSSRIQG